jgi:hypothetical protein
MLFSSIYLVLAIIFYAMFYISGDLAQLIFFGIFIILSHVKILEYSLNKILKRLNVNI